MMEHEKIVDEILCYIYETNPLAEERKPLPLDESLYDRNHQGKIRRCQQDGAIGGRQAGS
jgi:hypothetical protein